MKYFYSIRVAYHLHVCFITFTIIYNVRRDKHSFRSFLFTNVIKQSHHFVFSKLQSLYFYKWHAIKVNLSAITIQYGCDDYTQES